MQTFHTPKTKHVKWPGPPRTKMAQCVSPQPQGLSISIGIHEEAIPDHRLAVRSTALHEVILEVPEGIYWA